MIYSITISQVFSDFLNRHEKIILKLFNIVKSFKNHIPNTYKYSNKYPPLRKNYKYTDKLFIGCILYIALNGYSWNSFLGPISGKQVHKKFMEYSKSEYFQRLFEKSIKQYLLKFNEKIKFLSIDSSVILNKSCKEISKGNPLYKNKKIAKVTTIVDSMGTPLEISINVNNNHDAKLFESSFNNLMNNNAVKKSINNETILLADKGYDSKSIREKLNKVKLKHVIAYNKRNCKTKCKINKLTTKQKIIYKNRIKVEHYFGIIKKYPKINNVYEKTIESYKNLLLLVSSMMLIKRTNG